MDRVNATAERKGPVWFIEQQILIPLTMKLPAQAGLQEVSTRMHLASRQKTLTSNWRSKLRLKPLNGDDLRSKETTVSDQENSQIHKLPPVVAEHKEQHQNQVSAHSHSQASYKF